MTPYEKLKSLPKAERFLKPDVTFEHPNALAMQLSIFSGRAGTIIACGTTGAEQHRSKQVLALPQNSWVSGESLAMIA